MSDQYRRPGIPRSQLSPESGSDRLRAERDNQDHRDGRDGRDSRGIRGVRDSQGNREGRAARLSRDIRCQPNAEEEDERLAAAVTDRLRRDPGLRAYALHAVVQAGHVTLQGIVDVLADRERAHELALTVPGVVAVDSALSVSTDGRIDDEDVALEVAEELAADPRVDTRRIGARVEKGVVHLEGRAPHEGMVRAAAQAVARARGVRDLISHVVLEDEAQTDDASLVNRVETALASDAAVGGKVDPQYIRVESKGGTLHLHGWVNDDDAFEAAMEIASNVEGVVRVDGSGLRVGGPPPNPARPTRGPYRNNPRV